MSEKFFTPDDFALITRDFTQQQIEEAAAHWANLKLEAALGPPITGFLNTFGQWGFGAEPKHSDDTHTCRPFNIQPLVSKEPCKHLQVECSEILTSIPPIPVYRCKRCRVRVEQKWEAI